MDTVGLYIEYWHRSNGFGGGERYFTIEVNIFSAIY